MFERMKKWQVVSSLKTIYESVSDIDLFIGGVTEKPLPNAVLGPTFAGIFALQFINSRRTDRFFYNNNVGQPYAFTPSISYFSIRRSDVAVFAYRYLIQKINIYSSDQVAEIEKVSLARIICDNSDGTITTIQPKVFHVANEYVQLCL